MAFVPPIISKVLDVVEQYINIDITLADQPYLHYTPASLDHSQYAARQWEQSTKFQNQNKARWRVQEDIFLPDETSGGYLATLVYPRLTTAAFGVDVVQQVVSIISDLTKAALVVKAYPLPLRSISI